MTGFTLDWLDLREPADAAARNRVVLAQLAADFVGRRSVAAIDLGAGSGSTVRAVAPHLPTEQCWTLVDDDPALLATAAGRAENGAVRTRRLDIAREVDLALTGHCDLVTCSALLDLVSRRWLGRLVDRLRPRGIPFYAALSYDGAIRLEPAHPLNETVVELFNHHQQGDKGFGRALGPDAGRATAAAFESAGYAVLAGRADWRLDPSMAPLQRALVDGIADAVTETGQLAPTDLAAWRTAHLAAIEAGLAFVQVGHTDLYARR